MSADNWGPCPACKVPLSRANASRLRSGAVVHVGCQGGRMALAAALRKGDAELPNEEPAPLVQASGPTDYEALGRERCHDTPEVERAAQLPRVLEQLKAGTPEPDRKFADGWLAEHARWKARAEQALGDQVAAAHAIAQGVPNGLLCSVCRESQFDTPNGETCRNGHGGAQGVRPDQSAMTGADAAPVPAPAKVRRRVSLRDPAAPAGLRLAGIGGASAVVAITGGEVHRGLVEEVARAAAEPKADVILQALHVAGGANGVGIGEVRQAEQTSTRTTPNIDVRSEPSPTREAVEAVGSVERVVRAAMKAAVELGPDGTEVVALPPLAKAEPPPEPEPVHMLVPGFPGHTCCAEPVEAPKPAVPPTRAKRARGGQPAVPASPGSPAVPGTPVTTDRAKATCPDCLEVYDDAEALAFRIDELRGEDEPEPCNCEDAWEELVRKQRDKDQLAMAEALKAAPADRGGRPEGELVHLFDGFPDPRPTARSGFRLLEARCGIEVKVSDSASGIYSSELVAVPFLEGHPRCCGECAALPQPPGARSFGAFVPAGSVVGGGKIRP